MHRFILLLALVSGLANAADGAAPKPADGGKASADASNTTPAADASPDAKAQPKPEPKPRHPDTAGRRRIMAGSGRT